MRYHSRHTRLPFSPHLDGYLIHLASHLADLQSHLRLLVPCLTQKTAALSGWRRGWGWLRGRGWWRGLVHRLWLLVHLWRLLVAWGLPRRVHVRLP